MSESVFASDAPESPSSGDTRSGRRAGIHEGQPFKCDLAEDKQP